MRWRSMVLAGAAVLAAVHVLEVLTAARWWRFAELVTFALLAAYSALRAEPRWIGPVILSPLLLDALLTIPPAAPPTYGWEVEPGDLNVNPWVDAIGGGFRQGGPMLLVVLALFVTRPPSKPLHQRWRTAIVLLPGLAVAAYAAERITLGGTDPGPGRAAARALAVLVPVALALAAVALAAVRGRLTLLGGFLIAAATLPMIDTLIGAVPTPYSLHAADGLFGWDAITPTRTFPAPVAAIEEALLLAGVLALMAGARFRRSGG